MTTSLIRTIVVDAGYETHETIGLWGWVVVHVLGGALAGENVAVSWTGGDAANVCYWMGVPTLRQLIGREWFWQIKERTARGRVEVRPAFPVPHGG